MRNRTKNSARSPFSLQLASSLEVSNCGIRLTVVTGYALILSERLPPSISKNPKIRSGLMVGRFGMWSVSQPARGVTCTYSYVHAICVASASGENPADGLARADAFLAISLHRNNRELCIY